jgi:hypothetical protein
MMRGVGPKQEATIYMKLRAVITLLLTFTLTVNAASFARNVAEDPTSEKEDNKITAEEDREAREIAAQFSRRWQETEDIGPLVKEFFVADFADRLRHEPSLLFFAELRPELMKPEAREELRRNYVAMTNLLYLFVRLYEVYAVIRMQGHEREDLNLNHILPVNIWKVLNSNPTMKTLLDEEVGESAQSRTEHGDQDADRQAHAKRIDSMEQLHSLTTTLEQAVVLLRDHVRTLPSTIRASELTGKQPGDAASSSTESSDPLTPRVRITGEEFYGYPAGTRLISVELLPFQIDLVRAGGRLKVLSVYIRGD